MPWIPLSCKKLAYRTLRGNDVVFLNKIHQEQPGKIFIHIPKVAGNSIEKGLDLKKTGHKSLRLFELALPSDQFRSSFKFSFVRDPWTRLASAFHYLRSEKASHEDRAWATRELSEFGGFSDFVHEWINNKNVYKYIHFIPQFEFMIDWRGEINLDFVGRMSNLHKDFEKLQRALGLHGTMPLAHLNKTVSARNYLDEYSPQMISIVGDAYAKDIELLGFQYPDV